MNKLNDKKTINGWAMYDWANSVFNLVIVSAIFPQYFTGVTKIAAENAGTVRTTVENGVESSAHYIKIFGFEFLNTALFSYCGSVFYFIVALLAPMLSGIADYAGWKKRFMMFYVVLGSVSVANLYFFNETNVAWGVIFFILAGIGWGGSLVYYNGFLPEIASPDQYDRVSAKGFSLGYVGSVLLLLIGLVPILFPKMFFDFDGKMAEIAASQHLSGEALEKATKGYFSLLGSRISFLETGLWWLGFSIITFLRLPKETPKGKPHSGLLLDGFRELKDVAKKALSNKRTFRFLLGFFAVSMGVQTVMFVATLFGKEELKLETAQLIATIIVIQFIAIAGAYVFSWASRKIGNIGTLLIATFFWVLVCVAAFFVKTPNQFYALAVGVGFVMGGIQSLFRSTFAKFIPVDDHDNASYFSLYEFTEKIAIVLGTFAYGLVNELTGSMRTSTLVLAGFFITGLILLSLVPKQQNVEETN